ncbi:hypothetical protein [Vulgatibacter incomptus]|nr:hypothetical protein [Vulgatibacter incomptus]
MQIDFGEKRVRVGEVQMQIDFGEKRVRIGDLEIPVHLFVAVLSFSRRIFVKAFLWERQDDWFEGLTAAFKYFGRVRRTLLTTTPSHSCERSTTRRARRSSPLAISACARTGTCPRRRAGRTKGNTESGVKYANASPLRAGRSTLSPPSKPILLSG